VAKRVLIATGNAGKLVEFQSLLAGSGYELLTPSAAGLRLVVEETGTTYAENALIKARAYAAASGLPALGDDSGIEVDALGGAPGLYSARFGGPGLSDNDRNALLLRELERLPPDRRRARMRCALALQSPDGRLWQAAGVVEGSVATVPRGEHGFGYDPLFVYAELGRTAAEVSEDEKNRVSHRARAVWALLAELARDPL
jgi:XTP/dITP diphosphohydrolase